MIANRGKNYNGFLAAGHYPSAGSPPLARAAAAPGSNRSHAPHRLWQGKAREVVCLREDIEQRARDLALYIVENNATVRDAAQHFRVSKSTVHKDLTERLRHVDRPLYTQARAVLEHNKAERHLRGGEATRRKYKGR